MARKSFFRAAAPALVAVAFALAATHARSDDRYARTQAECDRINAEMQDLNHRSLLADEAEMAALTEAMKARETADQVRKMGGWELEMRRIKMEGELEKQIALREEEDRGAAFSQRDPYIIKLRATIAALKDQQRNAGAAAGSPDQNALDAFANELRGRATRLKEKSAALTQQAKDSYRQHQACLSELNRQRASNDDAGDRYASAAGADDYPPDAAAAGYDGYGSDANPIGPGYRPSRLRPVRDDGWGGYDEGYRERGGRRRGGDWAESNDRSDRKGWKRGGGGREDRGDRREKGEKRGKHGAGGAMCHHDPATGQQHCG